MTPLGASLTLFFCLLVMVLNNRGAVLAMTAAVCYVTQGQELNVGLHFPAMRLVLLAGLIRIIFRGELAQVRFNRVDGAVIAYVAYTMVVSTFRDKSAAHMVYEFGFGYNALMSYFVLRALLTSREDLRRVLAVLPWIVIPFALLILLEVQTGRNVFAVFGGVDVYSMMRDGHVRGQGAFRSPITAGAFGATFTMLFCADIFARGPRGLDILGLIASLVIVGCAHSSGPLLGLMVGLASLICWRFRAHMRTIRWGILGALVTLHLVMKAPVWFLLGRISDVVGGGGYFRAYLIDKFITNFGVWWLAGTNDTAGWMATRLAVNGQSDLTNQFVSDGVAAGLVALVLSVLVLIRCFQAVGTGLADLEDEDEDEDDARLLWGVGAALAGSIAILFSVTYFDQMHVIWYFLLASVSACAFDETRTGEESEEEEGAVPDHSMMAWQHRTIGS